MVQTPRAKCGDRGQVKCALWIGVTKGSEHVCRGKLNRPPLPSSDRVSDVRYPGGWNVGGQDSGCEISGWMECRPILGLVEHMDWDFRSCLSLRIPGRTSCIFPSLILCSLLDVVLILIFSFGMMQARKEEVNYLSG